MIFLEKIPGKILNRNVFFYSIKLKIVSLLNKPIKFLVQSQVFFWTL